MASPKGAHQKRHACVAELTNGTTIACALRLGLTLLVCTSTIFVGKGQAKAGIAILRMGGNAVDAAIAALTTSFIAEPVLTSAGGGGFMLTAGGKGKAVLYDGFARMPSGRMSAGIKKGRPRVVLGSGGSNRLRGAILQVLSRHLLLGQNIASAVHAPRLHNEGMALAAEPGCLNDAQCRRLRSLDWSISDWRQASVYFGGVHAITMDARGQTQAVGDPRRGGSTAFT